MCITAFKILDFFQLQGINDFLNNIASGTLKGNLQYVKKIKITVRDSTRNDV